MKKSDYKIEFSGVGNNYGDNYMSFEVMRKNSLFSFTVFGYKIRFITQWVSISNQMKFEDAKQALQEIHEWIDGGGK